MTLSDFLHGRSMHAFAHRYRMMMEEMDHLFVDQWQAICEHLGTKDWSWTALVDKHPDFQGDMIITRLHNRSWACGEILKYVHDKYHLEPLQSNFIAWKKFPQHERLIRLYEQLGKMIDKFCETIDPLDKHEGSE